MVTDYRTNRLVDYDLLAFLKDINCTGTQFKLLCFWGRYPKAKLSLYTVVTVPDTAAINLRGAISDLVAKGILTAQNSNDELTVYAIADNGTKEYIDKLGGLDYNEAMSLEKQLKE